MGKSLLNTISERLILESNVFEKEIDSLFDVIHKQYFLETLNNFIPFDSSLARTLAVEITLWSGFEDKDNRQRAIAILCEMSKVKWSAAASAIGAIRELLINNNSLTFENTLVKWLLRGKEISDIDQDVASAYFNVSAEVANHLGIERIDHWAELGQRIAKRSWKTAREYFRTTPEALKRIDARDIETWAQIGITLLDRSPKIKASHGAHSLFAIGAKAGKDRTVDIALEYFKSSPQILARVSVHRLKEWALQGLDTVDSDGDKGISFFSMQSGRSRQQLEELIRGIELKNIHGLLNAYIQAMFGRRIMIRPSSVFYKNLHGLGRFFSVTDGERIFLPPRINIFVEEEINLKAYKWFLSHETGHIIYGTFSLSPEEIRLMPELSVKGIAFKVFEFIEDERIDYRLSLDYPGLEKDRGMLIEKHKHKLKEGNIAASFFEAAGAGYQYEGQDVLLQVFRSALKQVHTATADVSDSLRLAIEICSEYAPYLEMLQAEQLQPLFYRGVIDYELLREAKVQTQQLVERLFVTLEDEDNPPSREDIKEALLRIEEGWGSVSEEVIYRNTPEDIFDQVKATLAEMEEEKRLRRSVFYDEWDMKLKDYKKEWCRVREIDMPEHDDRVYQGITQEYHGLISLLKGHFGLLRPDRTRRYFREQRGDEIDFDALIETLVDRHAGIAPSDRIYIRRDKRARDVSVAFLADMSFSTGELLSSGKRIIDVEREGLALMAEALESIGDSWAIYGFSSKYRERVDFYVIKDFRESFTNNVKSRFEGIRPIALTRLGAAIRHANSLLSRQHSLIRLLILLSDGRPYDIDYGDIDYSIEDTKAALWEGRRRGINSFCITVDKESSEYLPYMYGEAHYTLIDNVELLPISLPLIYKKLTT